MYGNESIFIFQLAIWVNL